MSEQNSNNLSLWEFLRDSRDKISQQTHTQCTSENAVLEICAQKTWDGYFIKAGYAIWKHMKNAYQPIAQVVIQFIATMAYFSMALSITYSAVINLVLLQMPQWLYVSVVVIISVTEFASSIIDWYIKHHCKSKRFSDRKIASIERRFLLHPELKKCNMTEEASKALENFSAYLFLERSVREEVQNSRASQKHQEDSHTLNRYSQYPIELQCRLALALSPALAQAGSELKYGRTVENELAVIYEKIRHALARDTKQFMSITHNGNNSDDDTCSLRSTIKSWISRPNQKASILEDLAITMIQRFADFAMQYNDALNPNMSDSQKNKILLWQLDKYLCKRSKKEFNLLTVAQWLTGWSAQVIVWGSAIISRGLSVVANAPIQLISQILSMNINAPLCSWFFFSGWFTGVSSENTKKCLIKINRFNLSNMIEKLRLHVYNPMQYARFLIMTAASISTCYFSKFSVQRLLNEPESVGAVYLMSMLAQMVPPLIWPMLTPFWWIFTAVSSMINLYNDGKYYVSYRNQPATHGVRQKDSRYDLKTEKKSWSQATFGYIYERLPDLLMASLRLMAALALAALYYVSITRGGAPCLLAMSLTCGVVLMKYAKLSNLQNKVHEIYSGAESAQCIIENKITRLEERQAVVDLRRTMGRRRTH